MGIPEKLFYREQVIQNPNIKRYVKNVDAQDSTTFNDGSRVRIEVPSPNDAVLDNLESSLAFTFTNTSGASERLDGSVYSIFEWIKEYSTTQGNEHSRSEYYRIVANAMLDISLKPAIRGGALGWLLGCEAFAYGLSHWAAISTGASYANVNFSSGSITPSNVDTSRVLLCVPNRRGYLFVKGEDKRFEIPLLHQMLGGGGAKPIPCFALQNRPIVLEFLLASAANACICATAGTPDYTISDVAFKAVYIEMDGGVIAEVMQASGGKIQWITDGIDCFVSPITTSQTSALIQIPNTYMSLKRVYVAFTPQNHEEDVDEATNTNRSWEYLKYAQLQVENRLYPYQQHTIYKANASTSLTTDIYAMQWEGLAELLKGSGGLMNTDLETCINPDDFAQRTATGTFADLYGTAPNGAFLYCIEPHACDTSDFAYSGVSTIGAKSWVKLTFAAAPSEALNCWIMLCHQKFNYVDETGMLITKSG